MSLISTVTEYVCIYVSVNIRSDIKFVLYFTLHVKFKRHMGLLYCFSLDTIKTTRVSPASSQPTKKLMLPVRLEWNSIIACDGTQILLQLLKQLLVTKRLIQWCKWMNVSKMLETAWHHFCGTVELHSTRSL